jgi:Family of unknown function (DUF6069)
MLIDCLKKYFFKILFLRIITFRFATHFYLQYFSIMANKINFSKILTAAGTAIGLSVAINVALFFIFSAAGLLKGPAPMEVNAIGVAVSTTFFLLIGTGIYLLVARFAADPAKIFTYICIGGFILTLANPFMAGFPTGMAAVLDLMHVAPAYLLWRFLTRA